MLTYNAYFDTYTFSFNETFKASQLSYWFKSVINLIKMEKNYIPKISPIGVRKLVLIIDNKILWSLSNKITTCWNSLLKLYKQSRKENVYPKSPCLFISLFLSLFKSFFSPFLSSPLSPPFPSGAHDTWNF